MSPPKRIPCIAVTILGTVSAIPTTSAQQPSADDVSVEALIEQLGSGDFEKRNEATRALVAQGPRGQAALRRAAEGDDFEIALRARHLLAVLNELYFAGADIEVAVDNPTIAWNEPFTLRLRVRNASDAPIHVPFELDHAGRDRSADWVAQSVRLLDLADFLEVTDPSGKRVDFHMDDINEDPDLLSAVHARLERPAMSNVDPQSERVIDFPKFNRGWGRYRMLAEGDYRIKLVFQPQWDEQEMIDAGVGRIESNAVTVTVSKPAPEMIRNARHPATLTLRRHGDDLAVDITNQFDVAVRVNANLSTDRRAPYARLQWYVDAPGKLVELTPEMDVPPFAMDRLILIEAGQTKTIAREPMSAMNLPQSPASERASASAPRLYARYSNIACAGWQRTADLTHTVNAKDRRTLETTMPPRVLVTTITSNAIEPSVSE